MNPAPIASTPPPPSWRLTIVVALAFVAVLLTAYGPALHGGFLWDDDTHISANEALRSNPGLERIWLVPGATCQYYPLTFSVFWLEYHLWGLDPLGYHVVNVLLHAAVAVLLWRVLARLRAPGALLAAAIFALHPVMVMSVAWMTELKNTLSAALALGAIWAYLRFARVGVYGQMPEDRGQRVEWGFYLLALGLFQLAMFAKTAVSFVPATLLLILWWRRPRLRWADLWPLLPLLAIVIVMGRITGRVERLSGATGAEFAQTFPERVLIAGRSFWFYLGKLVWPANLSFIYPRWHVDPAAWWQWLFPLATGLLMAGLWLVRGRLGKAPLAALLHFFLCTSALILGMSLYMTRYSFVTDHWQYFGALGMCALAGAGLARGLAWLGRPAAATLASLLLLALAGATWRHSRDFASEEALCQAAMAQNPGWAHNTLGIDLLHQVRPDEAIAQFQQSLQISPDDVDARNDLGTALFQKGGTDEAIAQFQQALQIEPDYANAHYNLAIALVQKGRVTDAITHYQQALQIWPNYWQAQNNLALLLATLPQASQRDGPKAVELATKAVQITGEDNPIVLGTLAAAYAEAGRFPEAIATARRGAELADTQHQPGMVAVLQAQLKLYQAGSPLHDAGPR